MISAINISLSFGKRVLFDDVSISFIKGNCYGIIGANGAGKSTFLKILSGEVEPNKGQVEIQTGARLAVLKQDQYEYNEYKLIDTVIMGHQKLWALNNERNELYAKENPTEKDGIRAAEIEAEFGEIGGYTSESEASSLLSNLGVDENLHNNLMQDVPGNIRVRVLLCQALFGEPDILLLDEPTNDLDVATITWLEDFLADYPNVVIVVSHDRHFLDSVCTHIGDVDRQKISIQVGNYSFWYESSQLALRQIADKNKKTEDKRKDLLDFIARFSANASKSRQATSRKKALEKLVIEEIKPSTRRYPGIIFKPEREIGNQVLHIEKLSFSTDNEILFDDISFDISRGQKIGIISKNALAVTAFFNIISGKTKAQSGLFEWGSTVKHSYLPLENNDYFTEPDINLMDWLRNHAPTGNNNIDEDFLRSFLGKMLFSGDEIYKKVKVLSGGEKMRCMISRMMINNPNLLILDQPTAHLDLESITSFNESVMNFKGVILLSSFDHQFMQTSVNRIIELTPKGAIDKLVPYDEYLVDKVVLEKRKEMYEIQVL